MNTARMSVGIGLLLVSVAVHPVSGDPGLLASHELPRELGKLPRDRTVTVVGFDGTRLPGRVLGFDAAGTLLWLRPVEASADTARALPLARVASFEWRQRGRPTFGGIVAGMMMGGVVGVLIANVASERATNMDEGALSWVVGVGGGVVLGALTATVVPFLTSGTRTIDCPHPALGTGGR
jgi:hypothetical protein